MRTKTQAFLRFFAETITQILLAAVTLTVPFSDQIVITTRQTHGLKPFVGKCSITAYTTDQVTLLSRLRTLLFPKYPPVFVFRIFPPSPGLLPKYAPAFVFPFLQALTYSQNIPSRLRTLLFPNIP